VTAPAYKQLLHVREHRQAQALRAVADARALLQAQLRELKSLHAQLAAVRREQYRLLVPTAASDRDAACSAATLVCIDGRRALLRERQSQLKAQLVRMRTQIREARQRLTEAVQTYMRARARTDSIVTLRDRARKQEQRLAERDEERASEDHAHSRLTFAERNA
jgi:hypothetical protein